MSYLHPSAPVNSNGFDPDPLTPARLNTAREANAAADRAKHILGPLSDFLSFDRIGEDILHLTPFDDLPQADQDRIRERRRRAMQESHIPWVVNDAVNILSFLDDVDDLVKSPKIARDYLIRPGADAVKKLWPGRTGPADALDDARAGCKARARLPREHKLAVQNGKALELLAAFGLQALKSVFPAVRVALTVSQILQATDSLFGVGLQLGPLLGALMESVARGLGSLGLPFGPEHNKAAQLRAARLLQRSRRGLGAISQMHPEDQLQALLALDAATRHDVIPPIVLAPEDFPSLDAILDDPSTIPREAYDLARSIAALPYNMAAYAMNDLVNPAFERIAEALGIDPSSLRNLFNRAPDNTRDALQRLAEKGILPCSLCDAAVWQALPALEGVQERHHPTTGRPLTAREQAKLLGLTVLE